MTIRAFDDSEVWKNLSVRLLVTSNWTVSGSSGRDRAAGIYFRLGLVEIMLHTYTTTSFVSFYLLICWLVDLISAILGSVLKFVLQFVYLEQT